MRRIFVVGVVLAIGVLSGCGGGTTTNITVVAPTSGSSLTDRIYRIPAGSMEPTLTIGQDIVVAPLTSTPQVGSIVVFHPPMNAQNEVCGEPRSNGAACAQPESHTSSTTFVKRIVAGPGDVISILEGHVIRNGQREADSYIEPCAGVSECDFPTPIKIPADEWFMMGDNRGESDDSRFWGPVPTSWIVGEMAR
jgi:signal peptidase I